MESRFPLVVLTNASLSEYIRAYTQALREHPALDRGSCVPKAQKCLRRYFNINANKALVLLNRKASELLYVDDNASASLHALLFGFGVVVYIGNDVDLGVGLAELRDTDLEAIEPAFEERQKRFYTASCLDEIIFE